MDDLRSVWDGVGQPWVERMKDADGRQCTLVTREWVAFRGDGSNYMRRGVNPGPLPDLSDGPTRGGLLELVREATGEPYVYVARDSEGDVWHVYSSERREPLAEHAEEGMALLLAYRSAKATSLVGVYGAAPDARTPRGPSSPRAKPRVEPD